MRQAAAMPNEPSGPLQVPEMGLYRITPGDRLDISMQGTDHTDPGIAKLFRTRVSRSGTVNLPFGDPIKVGDLDLESAEQAIHDALVPSAFVERQFKLVVQIDVAEFNPTTVTVYGAVSRPGPVGLRNDRRSVVFALAASGITPSASGIVHVRSVRGRDHDRTYNLHVSDDLQRSLTATPLESGDIVIAEHAAPNVVYFTGLLNGGGQLVFAPGQPITFLQALAAAGGRDPITDPIDGTLVRTMPDGTRIRVALDLKAIERGDEPDFVLEPHDLVMVPHTFRTRMLEFLNQTLVFRAGATAVVNYDPLVEQRFDEQLNVLHKQSGNGFSNNAVGIPSFFPPVPGALP